MKRLILLLGLAVAGYSASGHVTPLNSRLVR